MWLRIVVGPNEKYGIPKPDHDLWEKHPIVNSQLLYQIRHGIVTAKPDIERFEGKLVRFIDGTTAEIDTIVYATGFNISFPFLDHDIFEWENGVPKRIAGSMAPNLANLYIFGLLQPRGGAGPLISAGSKLLAETIKLQEKIPHPVASAMAKKVEPSAQLLVGVAETMRNIKRGHLGLKVIERYYRKQGQLLTEPYPVPPAPEPSSIPRVPLPVERRTIDLDGRVSYVDFGGEGPPIVLVHGLGGSVENWLSVGPSLTTSGHVVALDLRGFGHSEMGVGGSAGVSANRELLGSFIRSMFDEPVTLVGNSMGGMISILQSAEEPDSVARAILLDPSVPTPEDVAGDPTVVAIFTAYAHPGGRGGHDAVGGRNLQPRGAGAPNDGTLLCRHRAWIDPSVLDAHFELADARAAMEWASAAHLEAARTLLDLKLRPDDYYALIRSVRRPVLVLQGDRDRLVRVESIHALREVRPDWEYEIYRDIGHLPMLECPERVVRGVRRWMAGDRSIDLTEQVPDGTLVEG